MEQDAAHAGARHEIKTGRGRDVRLLFFIVVRENSYKNRNPRVWGNSDYFGKKLKTNFPYPFYLTPDLV